MQPLLDSGDQISARAYAPKAGQFPLARIASLEVPATQSYEAFRDASTDLSTYDSSDFVGPLSRAFDSLRAEVEAGASSLETAVRASRLMPTFLGSTGPRDFLFVFENNAEVRSTGGLPGNLSLVHADEGRVAITQQEAAGPFGELSDPVLPLSPEERERLRPTTWHLLPRCQFHS